MFSKDILSYVKSHYRLKVLLQKYNYCQSLSEPYQGLSDLTAFEGYNHSYLIYSMQTKEKLLSNLQERLQAYYIENTYKICEQKRLQRQILAYSHRKVGWATPKYELNSNFSIEIKTNFGYGYVSYFYTRIKYKDLDIIPFSQWIKYERAHLFEIIRYSSKHSLKTESWIEALEYAKEACNLSLTDETGFMRKYIIDECESMVTGLENFLEGDQF